MFGLVGGPEDVFTVCFNIKNAKGRAGASLMKNQRSEAFEVGLLKPFFQFLNYRAVQRYLGVINASGVIDNVWI